ncbi:hypothetical protein EB118_00080 [bacterium]|nr:hypothetical protein [bacterium]
MQDKENRMRVYSIKQVAMENYNHPVRSEDYQPEDHVSLGEYEGHSYFAFNPANVTLQENEAEFEQRVYDSNNAEDKAHLDSIKNKLHFLRQEILSIKSKLFTNLDMFDVIVGIKDQDKYILDIVAEIKSELDAKLSSYGF